jgi:hypothetical protein
MWTDSGKSALDLYHMRARIEQTPECAETLPEIRLATGWPKATRSAERHPPQAFLMVACWVGHLKSDSTDVPMTIEITQ